MHKAIAPVIRLGLLLSLAAALTGCGKKNAPTAGTELEVAGPGPRPAAGAPAPRPTPPAGPLTDAECQAFAANWEKAVNLRSVEVVGSLIDGDALLASALAGLELPAPVRARVGEAAQARFAAQIIEPILAGATYKFLRLHAKADRKYALCRLLTADGRVNYHDVLLARGPGGRVRAADIYVLFAGELLSQTYRRVVVQLLGQGGAGEANRLKGPDRDLLHSLATLERISAARQKGDLKEARRLFAELPEGMRGEKAFLLLRVQLTPREDEAEYLAALEAFRSRYPEDAGVDLLSIDFFALKKDYAKALEAIGRVEKAVGGDPSLLVQRANVHVLRGANAEARQAARQALEQEPTLLGAYWALVAVSLKEKAFKETLEHLKAIDQKFAVQFADLTAVPEYAEFVKSPQYQEWLAYPKRR